MIPLRGEEGGTYIIIYQKVGACLSAPATFRLCLSWTQYCFVVCCRSEDESEEDSPSDHSQDQDDLPLGTKLKVRYGRGRNQKIYEAKVRSVGGASFQHAEWCWRNLLTGLEEKICVSVFRWYWKYDFNGHVHALALSVWQFDPVKELFSVVHILWLVGLYAWQFRQLLS